MMPPSISILMPVYNTEAYLPACLDSILAQDFPDWELLAVDDFSSDGSARVLADYARQDDRIHVLSNREKGIIPALRLAYSRSRGAYLTRMDSDDLMPPQKLSTLHALLRDHGKGHVATGQVKYIGEEGVGNGYRRYEAWLNRLAETGAHYADIYRECVIPSPCWMLHREDLEACGAFRPGRYPEDYDLVFRFYEQGLKVVAAEEVLHVWRDRPDRASRTDETYADNAYLRLKVPYFLELDYHPERPLVVWGAGPRGKRIAGLLQDQDVSFHWICNTPSKWGQKNGDLTYRPVSWLEKLDRPQVIVSVAAPPDQTEIRDHLQGLDFTAGRDYFFFC